MKVFFLGEWPRRLYVALHEPVRPARVGLVFCPPLWVEMERTYKHFARWAKKLADDGVAVLRYQPYGSGDSDGSMSNFSCDSAQADALAAARCLRERTGVKTLGIVGLRFGGSIAVHSASVIQPDFLVLWSPIANLRQYCRELLRMRLQKEVIHQQCDEVKVTTSDMVKELEAGSCVDLMGYDLSPELYRQMNAHPSWPESPPAGRVLWLDLPHGRRNADPIVKTWRERGCRVETEYSREAAFWDDSFTAPVRFEALSSKWLEGQ